MIILNLKDFINSNYLNEAVVDANIPESVTDTINQFHSNIPVFSEEKAKKSAKEVANFFDSGAFDAHKFSFAYLYYANDITRYMPKFIFENGVKVINPYYNRIYKLSSYKFAVGKEYYKEHKKIDPDYMYRKDSPVNRDPEDKPIPGWETVSPEYKPCQQNIKSKKLALPLTDPTHVKQVYIVINDYGVLEVKEYNDIKQYLKPKSETTSSALVKYQMFYVEKIFCLRGGGKNWINRVDFLYPDLVPFLNKINKTIEM